MANTPSLESKKFRETAVYAAMLVAITLAILCAAKWLGRLSDDKYAQALFHKMVEGNVSVQDSIDWQGLHALGGDLGQEYGKFRKDDDRRNYRKNFIKGFGMAFKKIGGTEAMFENWRTLEDQEGTVTVAADYVGKEKSLLLVISKTGRKLVDIRFSDQDSALKSGSGGACCIDRPWPAKDDVEAEEGAS